MAENKSLNVALVGGPMYDHLYTMIPEFEEETGYQVNVGAQLIHPELNEHLAAQHQAGTMDYDLISTHTKYAPSQIEFLLPLDDDFSAEELADFVPSTIELARIDGRLMGIPRNIDVRLLYYRRDLFEDPAEQEDFQARFGYALQAPETWEQVLDIARHFTRPHEQYGYAFPGRYSGLFGTFFELTAMMGGKLFHDDLSPAFVDEAGEAALDYLRDLYLRYAVTPRSLPDWHYDEVAQSFRSGLTVMVTDWPSGFGTMRDAEQSAVAEKLDLTIYPVGPTGERWVYAGGFTFAIPTSVRDVQGTLALLRFLTSESAQWLEAQRGAVSVRQSVRERAQQSVAPHSLEARRLEMLEKTVQDHMLIPPKFPSYPAVEDALWMALQSAIVGKRTVKNALAVAAREVKSIIA